MPVGWRFAHLLDIKLMDKKVDYDQLAPTYDQRFASKRPSGVAHALQEFVVHQQSESILEVGCGTGHWLGHLAQLGPRCYGLDLSRGMLLQAQAHQTDLHLVQGSAPQLPFDDQAFDGVYCVNALHHFEKPESFVAEAYRLLRPDGWLAVIGSDPHDDRERWFGYDYFPGTYETDLARFPREKQLTRWIAQAGFRGFQRQVVERISKRHVDREVLSDPYLQQTACSQLALLSKAEFNAGLARLEEALTQAEQRGTVLEFRTEITLFMWYSQKK